MVNSERGVAAAGDDLAADDPDPWGMAVDGFMFEFPTRVEAEAMIERWRLGGRSALLVPQHLVRAVNRWSAVAGGAEPPPIPQHLLRVIERWRELERRPAPDVLLARIEAIEARQRADGSHDPSCEVGVARRLGYFGGVGPTGLVLRCVSPCWLAQR